MARRQKTQQVPVTLPRLQSAPERWMANIRVSGFTITILGLVILAVVVLAPSLKLLVEQQQQIAALHRTVAQQRTQVTDLKGEVARWSDPAYVESQARSRLLYVYPGEYSFLVVNNAGQTTSADQAPVSSKIQSTKVDWIKATLSSVLGSGLTSKTADTIQSPVLEGSQ